MRMNENSNVLNLIKTTKNQKLTIVAVVIGFIFFSFFIYGIITPLGNFELKMIIRDDTFVKVLMFFIPFLLLNLITYYCIDKMIGKSMQIRSLLQKRANIFLFYFEFLQTLNTCFTIYITFYAYFKLNQ